MAETTTTPATLPPHLPAPLSATAAGHGKTLLAHAPGGERRQHFFHAAADAGDYPNPAVGHRGLQRLRDAGANQRLNAKFRQLSGAFIRRSFAHRFFLSGNLSAIGQFDQQQLPRNVEDRRYAAVPNWNGEFHNGEECNCHAEVFCLAARSPQPL